MLRCCHQGRRGWKACGAWDRRLASPQRQKAVADRSRSKALKHLLVRRVSEPSNPASRANLHVAPELQWRCRPSTVHLSFRSTFNLSVTGAR